MSSSTPPGFVPTRIESPVGRLTFSFLRPTDWHIAEIPAEPVDFARPEVFAPVCVSIASYGLLVFSVAVRPAYADGCVAQWLDWAARENGCDPGPIEHEQLGPHAAVACWGMQQSGDTVVRARLAMFEDGGRLIQASVMAPQAMWLGVHDMLRTILQSFTLEGPLGANAPLVAPGVEVGPSTFGSVSAALPAQARAAEAPRVAEEAEEGAAAEEQVVEEAPADADSAFTHADAALADDAATLDQEHPQNVRMREQGIGFAPRVLRQDAEARWAEVGSAALVASLRVPFGWFVLDDGRRLLVYDPSGTTQINFDLRSFDGGDADALLARVQAELAAEWPQARFLRLRLADMECLGVRDAVVDGEAIEQAFLVRQAPGEKALVIRVTSTPDGITRALDVAELLVRDLRFFAESA